VFQPNPVALKFDCRLWRASWLHSKDMAVHLYFDHTSRDGRTPWDRAVEQGVDAHGENIASGSRTAEGALEQFKHSDGHCKNMMNEEFTVFGVGYATGRHYGNYWTQMFSHSNTSLDTTCYPLAASMMQHPTRTMRRKEREDTAEAHQMALVETWSSLPV